MKSKSLFEIDGKTYYFKSMSKALFESKFKEFKSGGEGTILSDIYNKRSVAKERAIKYCYEMEVSLNAWDGRILSHNTFMFTYAFTFEHEKITYFVYITPTYNYIHKVED